MKTLLILLTITMSAAYAGPRVTGNGGGGIKKNGVYKTFYSSGAYINPEELTEVPGEAVYRQTISSLSGQGDSTSRLYSSGLPMGDRKFYNILEDRMDDATMKRLIEEYARVVKQPSDDLTIFAITDISNKTTYLLPNFYKLSENEQATILFHEAYWLLNPVADYAQVVNAEMIFQEFLELKEAGKYNHKLPRLLGKLLSDPTLALRSAVKEDLRNKQASEIFDSKGNIALTTLFNNTDTMCDLTENTNVREEKKFLSKSKTTIASAYVTCKLNSDSLQEVIAFQQKHPRSYFMQELVSFLSMKNYIYFQSPWTKLEGDDEKLSYKEIRKNIMSSKFNFTNADYDITGASHYSPNATAKIQMKAEK